MKKLCKFCNKEFNADRYNAKFCSAKCYKSDPDTKFYFKYYELMRPPRIRVREKNYTARPKVPRICKFCGKEFLGWQNKSYCSKSCREKKRDRSNYHRYRFYRVPKTLEFLNNKI